MSVRRQALIVVSDANLGGTLVEWLSNAGYGTRVIRSFLEARAELDLATPDVVVGQIKLGAYNGLHLAIRARCRGASTPVILIGDPDSVLQTEAERYHATYLTRPLDEHVLLEAVRRAEADHRPVRRSPRKRVPQLAALLDDIHARVIDVSYEGLRLEVERAEPLAIPPYFSLRIPLFNMSCRAQRVWTLDPPDRAAQWCGATIIAVDNGGAMAWRSLVDSMPGWTLLAQ